MADFVEKLKSDLVEQFKGKPHIEALMEVIGEQLQDVADFYEDLRTLRGIHTALGKQLDGVGDIVVLNRAEAGVLARQTKAEQLITDEVYRKYLIYKVLKNTNTCTYPDIIKAFRMFWETPLYYSEDPEKPATIILQTPVLPPEMSPQELLEAPIIKAAGVGIELTATTESPVAETAVFIGGAIFNGVISTQMPELTVDYNLNATAGLVPAVWSVMQTILPEIQQEGENL